jgi:hypothetical protein
MARELVVVRRYTSDGLAEDAQAFLASFGITSLVLRQTSGAAPWPSPLADPAASLVVLRTEAELATLLLDAEPH